MLHAKPSQHLPPSQHLNSSQHLDPSHPPSTPSQPSPVVLSPSKLPPAAHAAQTQAPTQSHHSQPSPQRPCRICGSTDHWARHCSQTTCWRCGGKGHWSWDCGKAP
mmetsp:Transcript_7078/g.19012  ORF Transcript_7078/g.19012 Transcript_7078/m.19012 type:complete len:106 (+) Transcript_7078:696-1013(+)